MDREKALDIVLAACEEYKSLAGVYENLVEEYKALCAKHGIKIDDGNETFYDTRWMSWTMDDLYQACAIIQPYNPDEWEPPPNDNGPPGDERQVA